MFDVSPVAKGPSAASTIYWTRQHWAVLVLQRTFLIWLIITVLSFVAAILGWSHELFVHALHLPPAIVQKLPLACLAILGFVFFGNVGIWQITNLEIVGGYLLRRFAWNQNAVPVRAMQDLQIQRSMFGLMLGYGTITIASGLSVETLTFVPDAEEFCNALSRARNASLEQEHS